MIRFCGNGLRAPTLHVCGEYRASIAFLWGFRGKLLRNVAQHYLFKDYEIHYNNQAPHMTQTWHHHEKIWETLYIIDGESMVSLRQIGETVLKKSQVVRSGDLIETELTPHTFSNQSDEAVRFLVVKRIPSDKDNSEVLKNDKVLG